MGLKRLPYAFCRGCKSLWEFGPDDIIEGSFGSTYWIFCECRCQITIHPELAQKMMPTPPVTVSEAISVKAEPQESDSKQLEKAMEALKAFKAYGTQARAAEALGVSVQTVRNRLKYLPSTVETEA